MRISFALLWLLAGSVHLASAQDDRAILLHLERSDSHRKLSFEFNVYLNSGGNGLDSAVHLGEVELKRSGSKVFELSADQFASAVKTLGSNYGVSPSALGPLDIVVRGTDVQWVKNEDLGVLATFPLVDPHLKASSYGVSTGFTVLRGPSRNIICHDSRLNAYLVTGPNKAAIDRAMHNAKTQIFNDLYLPLQAAPTGILMSVLGMPEEVRSSDTYNVELGLSASFQSNWENFGDRGEKMYVISRTETFIGSRLESEGSPELHLDANKLLHAVEMAVDDFGPTVEMGLKITIKSTKTGWSYYWTRAHFDASYIEENLIKEETGEKAIRRLLLRYNGDYDIDDMGFHG